MFFWLIPRNEKFFEIFMIQAGYAAKAAIQLEEIFQKPEQAYGLYPELKKIETKADDAKKSIINKLNGVFVTPIDREDILVLSDKLDDAVDIIEVVGLRIMLFAKHFGGKLDFFAPLLPETQRLLTHLKEASGFLPDVVGAVKLNNRVKIQELHQIVHNLEKKTDRVWQGEGGVLDFYIKRLAVSGGEGTAIKQEILFGMWVEMVCHEIERAVDLMKKIVDVSFSVIDKNG